MPSRKVTPPSLFPSRSVHRDPLTGLQLVPPSVVYADRFYTVFSSLLDISDTAAKEDGTAGGAVKRTVPDVVYLSEVTIPSSLLFHYEYPPSHGSSGRGPSAASSLLPSFYILVSTTHLYVGQHPSNRVFLSYSIFNDMESICLCQQSGCMVLRHRQAVAAHHQPHRGPQRGLAAAPDATAEDESPYDTPHFDFVFALKNTKETEFFLNILKTVKLTVSSCLGALDEKDGRGARGEEPTTQQATRYTPKTVGDFVQRWPVGSYEALPQHARPVLLGSPLTRPHRPHQTLWTAPLTFLGEAEVECTSRHEDCLYRSHEEEDDVPHEEFYAEESVLRAVLTEPLISAYEYPHQEDATAHDLLVADVAQLSEGEKDILFFLQHKGSDRRALKTIPAVAAAAAITPHMGEGPDDGDARRANRQPSQILGRTGNKGDKLNVVLARHAGAKQRKDHLLRLAVDPVKTEEEEEGNRQRDAPPPPATRAAVGTPDAAPTTEQSGWSAVTPLESSTDQEEEEARPERVEEVEAHVAPEEARDAPTYDTVSLSSHNSRIPRRGPLERQAGQSTTSAVSATAASNTSRYFDDYKLCYDEDRPPSRTAAVRPPPPRGGEEDSTFEDARSLLLQMRRENDYYQRLAKERLTDPNLVEYADQRHHTQRHPKPSGEDGRSTRASRKKQVSDFFESINRTFDTVH